MAGAGSRRTALIRLLKIAAPSTRADGADHQAEAVRLRPSVAQVLQPHLTPGDEPCLLVVDLDQPQLLQPAAVDRRTGRHQLAVADGAQEVGVVRDADDLTLIAEPEGSRRCWRPSRPPCSRPRRG